MYCWGNNATGQLGADTNIDQTGTPLLVAGGFSWLTLTSDGTGTWEHTCGVTTNGELYCWGANHEGQGGEGTDTRAAPVQVSTSLSIAEVAAGYRHTCLLTPGGAVYCMGDNGQGQLGDGGNTGGGTLRVVMF
jgi:alpha-tubulin suppressor-like RCC1 family protein